MAQHFLLSKAAKTLSLASVFRMSDEEAEQTFMGVRWADTKGEPVCPKCGCLDVYRFRRDTGLLCFECSACRKEFSLTSGTLFASRKLPIKGLPRSHRDFL
jgi:transposase-like protein